MACPAPVITTKRALEESAGDTIEVYVDEGAARENVTRFAINRGYQLTETRLEKGYSLQLSGTPDQKKPAHIPAIAGGNRVILVTSDRIGDGPEELGKLLMKNFIITLLDLPDLPDSIFFLNTGVHLTTEGSEVVEALSKLHNLGVEIMSCGLCLDYFHKKESLAVGSVTNMYNTAESMFNAGSIIRL
jgi:selenium metabolism protein YedF